MNDIMVSICALAYNHAPYIRQCLDGFLMQKTNFRFEVIINDDCSTDGTTEIIREYETKYPDIIKPIYHDENQWSKGIRSVLATFVYPNAKGKYYALCECDDFWTDPNKLQIQVEYMENNTDCDLVYTDYNILYEGLNQFIDSAIQSNKRQRSTSFISHLMSRCYIAPCSWLYRPRLVEKICGTFVDGTFAMALDAYATSSVHYLERTTATYRVLQESASHSRSLRKKLEFEKGLLVEQIHYMEKYPQLVTQAERTTVIDSLYGQIILKVLATNDRNTLKEAKVFWRNNGKCKYLIVCILDNPLTKKVLSRIYQNRGYRV